MLSIDQVPLVGKKVLIRVDFNVPMKDGQVANDARIRAALPTIQLALERCGSVMLMSHLGRPTEGEADPALSLEPVAQHLSTLMQMPVRFERNYLNGVKLAEGELVMLENVRFNEGEKADDETLSKQLAALCDVFVMDAFGTAHRAEASTHGVAQFAPVACAGLLLMKEVEALSKALDQPERPLLAIVGGAKVSSKLAVLEALTDKVDQLIVGGGILNTFLAAAGVEIGKSLVERELIPMAKNIIEKMRRGGHALPLPVDVVVAKAFDPYADATVKQLADIAPDDLIMDIGPETAERFDRLVLDAKTLIWNGPLGVFEFESFSHGTRSLALSVAKSEAYSLAGGGDTVAAIEAFHVEDKISYVSTGGGAFLECMEGKKLPAIEVLEKRARESA